MFAAAARPCWMATGERPGSGFPVWCVKTERSPITKTSGCPGIERSGSTIARPARSTGDAEGARERRRRDAGGPENRARGETLGPDVARRPRPRRSRETRSGPRPRDRAKSSSAARRELSGRYAGRMRGPASTSTMRASRGSIERKSLTRTWREISAIAPASSTPVGPPPTTTNVSRSLLAGRVGLALRLLEGEQDAAADLDRVLERLQPGRVLLPVVVAEVRVSGAGGEDQEVVGERSVGEANLAARRVDARRRRRA